MPFSWSVEERAKEGIKERTDCLSEEEHAPDQPYIKFALTFHVEISYNVFHWTWQVRLPVDQILVSRAHIVNSARYLKSSILSVVAVIIFRLSFEEDQVWN